MIGLLGCLWISEADQADRLAQGKDAGRPDRDTDADADADADTDSESDTDSDRVGDIELGTTALSFGAVPVDEASSLPLSVRNTGSADLLLSNASVDSGRFTIGKAFDFPEVIPPGDEVVISVTFVPVDAATYAADLTLYSDDPDEPERVVILSGEGETACGTCAPRLVVDTGGADDHAIDDFNSVFGAADERALTLTNEGDEELVVDDVYVNNDFLAPCGEFTLSGWGGLTTLRPAESTTVTVSYVATETCLEVAQTAHDMNVLHVLSNDPTEPDYVVSLTGVGL